jgi:hypothetical protein
VPLYQFKVSEFVGVVVPKIVNVKVIESKGTPAKKLATSVGAPPGK